MKGWFKLIKIDFHIHSISTKKDPNFYFSIDKLRGYVHEKHIDAIAITNHNVFDEENYELISNSLQIPVFPGIEIDFESGHILVITDTNFVDSFCEKAKKIEREFQEKGSISLDFFKTVFAYSGDYLFIPHYEKKPKVPKQILSKMGSSIFCGEVGNANKFVRLYKENNNITPVIFSDFRPSAEVTEFRNSQTFLDIDSISFSAIKECLKDKDKVFLNDKKERFLFPILENGTLASTGLNVIMGKRSTGKTHTLDSIFSIFGPENVKYIKQFELIEKDKDKAEKEFNKNISKGKSLFTEDYLKEFKEIVDSIKDIDVDKLETECEDYLSSLKSMAIDIDKRDSYAKVPVYMEQKYNVPKNDDLPKLVDSVICLLDSGRYKDLISKYVSFESLIALLRELIGLYIKTEIQIRTIKKANAALASLKKKLEHNSSLSPISFFDPVKYATYKADIQMFSSLANRMKKEIEIKREPVGRFFVVAKRRPIISCQDLISVFGKGSYSPSFQKYSQPYAYYLSLKENPTIKESDIYRGFFIIDYSILNENGYPISGGQRAEYNLEKSLADAENYEMLLIDEPESSFDNIFLKADINKKIKELSTKMPVFVSTHNNVVGASIKPDYVLYTQMKVKDGNTIFDVYGATFGDKVLESVSGSQINSYVSTMNCLEGGETAYKEREETYETIKD